MTCPCSGQAGGKRSLRKKSRKSLKSKSLRKSLKSKSLRKKSRKARK